MLFRSIVVTLLAGAFLFGLTPASAAHVHGAGNLDVSIDDGKITIDLEMPLDSIVGFEHPPKTPQQRAALTAAMRALQNAAVLFIPTPTAHCALVSSEVNVPYANRKVRGDESEHVDVDANYVFRCTRPATLRGIETSLFRRFKHLQRLEVQRAGPAGQGAAQLTPKQPVLSW